jgi:hypothetical protein
MLFQLEAGDAIGQQAPCPVVPVIDMHLIAARPSPIRGASSGSTPIWW